MIDLADRMMLASVQVALSHPFRDPVRVSGQLMPRRLARQIERQLLRLRLLEQTSAQFAPATPLKRGFNAEEGCDDPCAVASMPCFPFHHEAPDAR